MSAIRRYLAISLLPIFIVMVVVVQGCKKEYCWRCESKATSIYINNPTPSTSLTEEQLCNKTEEEIRQYEKNNTHVTQSTSGGQVVMTTSLVTYCDKN